MIIPKMTLDEFKLLRAMARMSGTAVNEVVSRRPDIGVTALAIQRRVAKANGCHNFRGWQEFMKLIAE